MIVPDIFDWPLIPSAMLFHAGGQAIEGGVTTQGVLVKHPEPGGRAVIDMTFNHLKEVAHRRLASWLFSKVGNGHVFRVRLANSLQLVDLADLGIDTPAEAEALGIPWDDDTFWDNDLGWAVEVGAEATAAALAGTVTLTLDMTGMDEGLQVGHVIGHDDHAYMVDDISYDTGIATVTVSPPLRSAVADGDYITFRPTMMGTVSDPAGFRGMFEHGFLVRPGSVTLVEALL